MVDASEHGLLSGVPPLENGDRLSRREFEHRYAAMLNLKKAELIEGVVFLSPTVRFRSHGQPHAALTGCLGIYNAATPGTTVASAPSVRLDFDNELQPDVVLLVESNGQTQISEDDFIEGAPELIAEVAASTVSIDLHDKKRAYRRNGVQEYIVWRVLDQELDWFSLQNGEYVSLPIDSNGIIKSKIFPGLWLSISHLLAGNMKNVLAVLQNGLNSEEHTKFLQGLQTL
jgi:Uma2 family endonuclease